MFTDEGDVTRRKERWFSQAHIATKLAPLLRQLASARKQWAWQRSELAYLELMKRHRGYDPEVTEDLENEVRRALESHDIPKSLPWEFELIDPSLSARMARKFDEAHCLDRVSFVFVYLGLPANPAALQVSDAKQIAFSSFAFYPIDPPADQRITVLPAPESCRTGPPFTSLGTRQCRCWWCRHRVAPLAVPYRQPFQRAAQRLQNDGFIRMNGFDRRVYRRARLSCCGNGRDSPS